MDTKKQKRRGVCKELLLLCTGFFLLFLISNTVNAKTLSEKSRNITAQETLKVAFNPLDGFFDYDEQGNETGYGVELLNKISQYTGLKFEYIKVDSWEQIKPMVIDGQVDIRMPGTMPSTPSTTLSYSSTGILDTYEVMLTMKDRTDLCYEDYDKIGKIKIAITTSFYSAEEVELYLKDIGVSKSQLVFCDEYVDCYELLKTGKVDALITNIMDMSDDMKMIARFNSVTNYITMKINNPYMKVIDEALSEIKLDEPMFLANLYEKWFPDRTTIPLTVKESEYLNSMDCITFAFRTDEGYLSHYSKGQFFGIYVEQAKKICEKLGKKFKAVSLEKCLNGDEKTDVYAGFFYDQNYAKEWNFAITSPIRDINYYIIEKRDKDFNVDTCRVAAIKEFRYTKEYLHEKYKDANFVYYDNYEDCLRAVESGDADVTVINNYIAEYYLKMHDFSDLSLQLSHDYSHLYCFAANDNNQILASILSKGLSMLTDNEMTETYISGQEDKPDTNLLMAFIYGEPVMFAVIVAGFVMIMLVFFLLLVFGRRSRKQNKLLEQALSTKSSFLARMSHDMRTPLNVIIGMEKLALDNKNPDDTDQCLNKIGVASEFLLGLINDILDVERIDSGKTKLHISAYSGEEFCKYIDSVIEPLCKQKNINFKYMKTGLDEFVVMQDKLRINQIYFNLLSNAVKFTPEGGNISLESKTELTDHNTVIIKTDVSDDGIGMSEEFQQHMFESFSQEQQAITTIGTGTGLGLTIVKQMCDLMNMKIKVSSKLGEGTTFSLEGEFEIAADLEDKELVNKEEINIDEIIDGKTVLVCEDHAMNQEIITRVLEKKNIIVVMAENGKEGLREFEHSLPGTFAAVLMDVRMPVMDGIQATREIRSLDRNDALTVPIIALTANAYEEDIEKCLEAGMNCHIAKPVKPETVYETLATYINKREEH